MNAYTLHSSDTAPAPCNEILSGLKKMIGFLPSVFAVMGATEPALRGFVELTTQFSKSSLTPVEQEIVHIAVSVENGCEYCVAGHTAFARMKKVPEAVLSQLRANASLSDPKLAALHDFTRAMVRKRGHVDKGEMQRFFDAGYTINQVQEVILGISEKTFSNLTSVALDLPLDEPFRPHAWARPMHRDAA